MKARTIAFTLCFVAVAACLAQNAQMGIWKLNEAKSKLAAGGPKNTPVVVETAADNVKVTVYGVGSDGKPTHNEWTGKFDGKRYPVTGVVSGRRGRLLGRKSPSWSTSTATRNVHSVSQSLPVVQASNWGLLWNMAEIHSCVWNGELGSPSKIYAPLQVYFLRT